jgi:hypothetical protein
VEGLAKLEEITSNGDNWIHGASTTAAASIPRSH